MRSASIIPTRKSRQDSRKDVFTNSPDPFFLPGLPLISFPSTPNLSQNLNSSVISLTYCICNNCFAFRFSLARILFRIIMLVLTGCGSRRGWGTLKRDGRRIEPFSRGRRGEGNWSCKGFLVVNVERIICS